MNFMQPRSSRLVVITADSSTEGAKKVSCMKVICYRGVLMLASLDNKSAHAFSSLGMCSTSVSLNLFIIAFTLK